MKYKLINRATNEAHFCDKVTVKGFDYYLDVNRLNFRDVATNNPSSHIPKVIDEVDYLYKNHKQTFIWEPAKEGLFHFKAGYNKSQETHPNSDEDMIEFKEWCNKIPLGSGLENLSTKELLKIWKSQQPKVIYYEEN